MKIVSPLLVCVLLFGCGGNGGYESAPGVSDVASLGRQIFFDQSLSNPPGVSCSSCHSPDTAFSDPSHGAVSKGAVAGVTGTRNSPSIMYALFSPVFGFSDDEGDYVGGQFWDGKGRNLEEQARNPLLGHLEMNLGTAEALRGKILAANYRSTFADIYGEQTLNDAEQTLSAVLNALSAFENTEELQPFTSKYDAWANGRATLSEQEQRGLALFNAPNKGNCAACHPSTGEDGSPRRALFTDFTYDNIGLPANRAATSTPDIGLYGTTGRPADIGRFKVPSLRNVAVTAPYFHNGVISSLKSSVHFYNARDVDSAIAAPEFAANMNVAELGNLGLTEQEEEDIAEFLKTLTDGFAGN